MISTPCSLGELIDKITILRIKAERIDEPTKLANVHRELTLLERSAREDGLSGASIDLLTAQLAAVNGRLWTIEDALRACERERRLRAALRRARAIGLLRKRHARGDQTRHQHARQLGLGRGEVLCVNGLSRESRNSVLSARTFGLPSSRLLGASPAADSDCRPAPPDDFRLAHFGCFVDVNRQSGRKRNVTGKHKAQTVARPVADPALG